MGCSSCGGRVHTQHYGQRIHGRIRIGQEASAPALDANIDPEFAENIIPVLLNETNPAELSKWAYVARYRENPIAERLLLEKLQRVSPGYVRGADPYDTPQGRGELSPITTTPVIENFIRLPQGTSPEGGYPGAVIAPSGLNVRISPNINSQRIGGFAKNTHIVLLAINDPNGWIHAKGINSDTGQIIYGWICSNCKEANGGPWVKSYATDLVTVTQFLNDNIRGLIVRSSPNVTSSNIIGELRWGQVVALIPESNGYGRVEGWAFIEGFIPSPIRGYVQARNLIRPPVQVINNVRLYG